MFVLKSDAGFKIFHWIATAASDFLSQSEAGASFFFNAAFVSQGYFFVNTVCSHQPSGIVAKCSVSHTALGRNILHCLRADDVLLGRHAVADQGLVSTQTTAYICPQN